VWFSLIILILKNGEKVIKNQFLFLLIFSKKINRQNKAIAYKAQWTALLGLHNPINPVKVAKFAFEVYIFSFNPL
jgi:hypothetical protein